MNSVNIIGRLVRDPEMIKKDDGLTICNLRIAIDDTHSKEDRADFISVTVFGNQAAVCERYLRKGFIAGVSGHIRSEDYTDKDGVRHFPVKLIAERIQFLQWPEREEKQQNEDAVAEADAITEAYTDACADTDAYAGAEEAV